MKVRLVSNSLIKCIKFAVLVSIIPQRHNWFIITRPIILALFSDIMNIGGYTKLRDKIYTDNFKL